MPDPSCTVLVNAEGQAVSTVHPRLPEGFHSDAEVRRSSLAREIYRRAQYQRLSWEDRKDLMGIENPEVARTAARVLHFDGMDSTELMLASPQEIIERFLALISKKQGREESERLRQAINLVEAMDQRGEWNSVRSEESAVEFQTRAAPAAPSAKGRGATVDAEGPRGTAPSTLPLNAPGAEAAGFRRANLQQLASTAAAQYANSPQPGPTVRLSRVGPKADAILGHALPATGRAATSALPVAETDVAVEKPKGRGLPSGRAAVRSHGAAPAATHRAVPLRQAQVAAKANAPMNTPTRENRAGTDGNDMSDQTMTAGSAGMRIMRPSP